MTELLDERTIDLLYKIKGANDDEIARILFSEAGADPASFRAFMAVEGVADDPDAQKLLDELDLLASKPAPLLPLRDEYKAVRLGYAKSGKSSLVSSLLADYLPVTLFRLKERNKMAMQIMQEFVSLQGTPYYPYGLSDLLPGVAFAVVPWAVASQTPAIYQPLARKLAEVYLADPVFLTKGRHLNWGLDYKVFSGVDIGQEFDDKFIRQMAGDLMKERVVSSLAMFIPGIGRLLAGSLSFEITRIMTIRVGRMVSIYYQNGGNWTGNKFNTYKDAISLSGNFDEIRKIDEVRQSLKRNASIIVAAMRERGLDTGEIRNFLHDEGVPDDLVDETL